MDIALQAANKIALGLGLIINELTMETLSNYLIDIELLYSVSPGAILRVPPGSNVSLDVKEAEMKRLFAEEKAEEEEAKKRAMEEAAEEAITRSKSDAESRRLANSEESMHLGS